MGLHESQSRLWENHVGRSRAFWQHCSRRIRGLFPDAARRRSTPRRFHRAVNRVRPGVNRVGADEMSYHLHILLRYELELALLCGDLAVGDLPRRLERAQRSACSASRPASDARGRAAGRPLGARHVRLFPDLYARQPLRRAAGGGLSRATIRSSDELRAGALRRPAGLAAAATSTSPATGFRPRRSSERATGAGSTRRRSSATSRRSWRSWRDRGAAALARRHTGGCCAGGRESADGPSQRLRARQNDSPAIVRKATTIPQPPARDARHYPACPCHRQPR